MNVSTKGSRIPLAICEMRINLKERQPRNEHEPRAEDDQHGVEPVEYRSLTEPAIDAGLKAETFTNVIRGRERQNGGRHQGCVDQAHPNRKRGELTGKWRKRVGGFRNVGDFR